LVLKEELAWVTNPLPGTSEDHPPSGGKPSEVEVGEESTSIPRRDFWSAGMSGAYQSSVTRRIPCVRAVLGVGLAIALLLMSACLPAHAMTPLDVVIGTTVDVDSITVGERLHVRYHIDCPDSLEVLPIEGLDMGTCRLISLKWDEQNEAGRLLKTADLELITLDLEEAHLPAAEVRFRTPSGDSLSVFTDEVSVPVRSLASAGGELKPLKEPWTAPADYRWLIIAAALAALAAVVSYFLWKRRKRRVVIKEAVPELPADFVALRELRRIENLKLLEAGEFKQYYTLITDAIRTYIEKRFGVDALDRTSKEILHDLEHKRRRVDHLEQLLQEADLVKFAKYIPSPATAGEAMITARGIVAKTARKSVLGPASSPSKDSVVAEVGSEQ
jgi:hypothetical protein